MLIFVTNKYFKKKHFGARSFLSLIFCYKIYMNQIWMIASNCN